MKFFLDSANLKDISWATQAGLIDGITTNPSLLAELAKIADNIVVKIPMIEAGMVAVRRHASEGIRTNVTLCFSSMQCLVAAKAGATYVSPFIGRLDDVGQDGMDVIREARVIFDNYQYATEILAASLRHPRHVVDA